MTGHMHAPRPTITRSPWDPIESDRGQVLLAAVREAIYIYAADWLRETGGTPEESVKVARDACSLASNSTSSLAAGGWSQKLDVQMAHRLDAEIERIQEAVTERICTGERLWITSGPENRWHRVATPTRALCGASINSGDKAWTVSPTPTPGFDHTFHRELDRRCLRCAKL